MSLSLKPYPEYKETGLPWLGRIPSHWQRARIKNLFRESDARSGTGRGELLSLTRSHGLIPHSSASAKLASAEDLSKYKVCAPGQLVMNRMQAWSGMFAAARIAGLVSPDYSVFTAAQACDVDFFVNLFRSPYYVQQFAANSKGIGSGFNRLYTPDFGAIPVYAPPPNEQRELTEFLRRLSMLFQKLIRAKRRVIELLNEQKQAIVDRAVTCGVEASRKLKHTGFGLVPVMPEEWDAKRLKAIAQIRYGLGQPPAELEHGLPLIRATNVDRGRILKDNLLRVDPEAVPIGRDAFLRKDEIIVVRSGALTADSAIIPETYDGAVAGYDMVVRVTGALPDFVALALLSTYVHDDQLVIASMRAAQPHLNAAELGNALVLLPPLKEQQRIVEVSTSELLAVDRTIERFERDIELFLEYRTRLIADVVTGKLDVRGIELPDMGEVEEPDTTEDIEAGEELLAAKEDHDVAD